jgi:hypothetical protein
MGRKKDKKQYDSIKKTTEEEEEEKDVMDVGPELMMANRLDGTNICLQWPVSKRAGRDITKQVGREKLPSAEYTYK